MAFPPIPVFPNEIDSDYTLYLVHNTTEAKLCVDNAPWSSEIEIVPVAASGEEIWADSGFGNIDGELFYYDSVELDEVTGHVKKLKGCARNLTGKTKFNRKGTWVRSFVIAEHHNQLVNAVLKVEDFVGYNFDPRVETLDWRIRNLAGLSTIFDDFNCPDVNFTWIILENNNETGILAQYTVEITPPGTINTFRLDFGDGEFTTTALQGTHRYALNANVDPIVTVSNDKCQMIQTPVERENPAEPPQIIQDEFEVAIPSVPDFPGFTLVPCEVPEPEIMLPPMVFPCISIEGQIGPLPSVIIGPDINMVSHVLIEGPSNPVQILHSVVTITGGFELPSIIFIDAPPTIVIDPPIPPTIVVVTQSSITMGLDLGDIPNLQVDWGSPPAMEITLTMAKEVKSPQFFAQDASVKNDFGDEFADLFDAENHFKVEYESFGIPTEIKVIAPDIRIDGSGVPTTIKIDTQDANIPERIQIFGPETAIPDSIQILGPIQPLPDQIEIVGGDNIPKEIQLVFSGKPIDVNVIVDSNIPEKIFIEMLEPLPERIILDASGVPKNIQVVGIPDTIMVTGFPDGIPVLFPKPEDMPKMELVYNGAPIEVKVTMDKMLASNDDGTTNCVMITPCPR